MERRSFDEINYSGRLTLDYQLSDQKLFSLGLYAGKRTKERTADILYYNNHSVNELTLIFSISIKI